MLAFPSSVSLDCYRVARRTQDARDPRWLRHWMSRKRSATIDSGVSLVNLFTRIVQSVISVSAT
jgi:hypothetical protein